MPEYEQIIKQSQDNVKSLGEKLKDLDKLFNEINTLKEASQQIPLKFQDRFKDIIKLSEEYTNTLGLSTKMYLNGNNTLFTNKLSELSIKVSELGKEISRLVNTDFINLFKELQRVFISQTRTDIEVELKRFEEKSKELQARVNELKKPIERLEGIDLEKHFNSLQKTLSDIFGSINAVNHTLTGIVQSLTTMAQALSTIQSIIVKNHSEAKEIIERFEKMSEIKLTLIEKNLTTTSEITQNKLLLLSKQVESLQKSARQNRIIQLAGSLIIFALLLYLSFI